MLIGIAALTISLAACDLATNTTTNAATSTTVSTATTTTTGTAAVTTSTLRVFTLSQLAAYNGDNGTTAYMAVNGTVYDVTNADQWTNGWHQGLHLAGTDATTAFAGSPHSQAYLDVLTIVGTLGN